MGFLVVLGVVEVGYGLSLLGVDYGWLWFEFCVYSLPFVVVNGFEKNGVMKMVERWPHNYSYGLPFFVNLKKCKKNFHKKNLNDFLFSKNFKILQI